MAITNTTQGDQTIQELKALSDIIKTSIDQIERTTKANGLVFPSPHTAFSPETEAARLLPDVVDAVSLVTAAAAQLTAYVRPPPMTVCSMAMLFHIPTAMHVASNAHVPEILRDSGQQGMHVNDIAKVMNVDPPKLARILRLLASNHFFVEVSPDVFANNRLSTILDTGKDVQMLLESPDTKHIGAFGGITAAIGHMVDESMKAASLLSDTLLDPKTAKSYDASKTAMARAFNYNTNAWDWYESPGNEFRLSRFGSCMDGHKNFAPPDAVAFGYNWEGLKKGALVVDVGGGVGSQSLSLAKHHSNLRFEIQDSERVLSDSRKFWTIERPGAIESGLVTFRTHDFFQPQPVKNADVFLLRMILHDWADEYCIRILRHLRDAATPSTTLVVVDNIMSYACEEAAAKEIPGAERPASPYPLLANRGEANMIAYLMDTQMMSLFNGTERTISQLRGLLESSGWKLVEINHGPPLALSHQKAIAIPA